MALAGIVAKPFKGLGGFFAMALDTFVCMFRRPFAWREYLLQTWFVARVSLVPTLMLSSVMPVVGSYCRQSAVSSFEAASVALLPAEIGRLLSPLDEREREILKLRFGLDRGEPRTLEEVGEHFNLTRERIRQIEARAMSKLRHPSADTGARDLLSV